MLIPATLFLATPALATTGFDGTYTGAIRPTPDTVASACAATPLTVKVTDGKFSANTPPLNGFVNVKGFVTGKLRVGDGRALPFEGRVDDNEGLGLRLVAGMIDEQTHCDWTIDLAKQ
jgi:hypothetical protein